MSTYMICLRRGDSIANSLSCSGQEDLGVERVWERMNVTVDGPSRYHL